MVTVAVRRDDRVRGCLTVITGGTVSSRIGLGRTIVRWELSSLTTGM